MRQREEFIAEMVRKLPDSVGHYQAVTWARAVMRLAKTHHRLAEAECNGDWPADNGTGETVECAKCGERWRAGVSKKTGLCKSCRIEDAIRLLCEPHGFRPIFQGDPRGCTVRIATADEPKTEFASVGTCVPV